MQKIDKYLICWLILSAFLNPVLFGQIQLSGHLIGNMEEQGIHQEKLSNPFIQSLQERFSKMAMQLSAEGRSDRFKAIPVSAHSAETEMIIQKWTGTQWEDSLRFIYSYDGVNDDPVDFIVQAREESEWINRYRELNVFNASGQLMQQTSFAWHDFNWVPFYNLLYEYDADGNQIEILEQQLRTLDKGLEDYIKTEFFYYEGRLLKEELSYFFSDSIWVKYNVSDYVYDYAGFLAEKINSRNTGSGVFIYTSKWIYTYHSSGQIETKIWQSFDTDRVEWLYVTKTVWQYHPSGYPAQITEQVYDGHDWVNLLRTITVMDPAGSYKDEIVESWESGAWINKKKTREYYDENENTIIMVEQTWEDGGWKNVYIEITGFNDDNLPQIMVSQYWEDGRWVNNERLLYNYAFGTSVNEDGIILPESIQLGNYPNPFNPSTTIQITLPAQDVLSVRIYDLRGRAVKTLVSRQVMRAGVHTLQWDGTDESGRAVSSGIYVYRVEGEKISAAARCMLIK